MKLYSRGQAAFFSVLGVLIGGLFVLGIGLLGMPGLLKQPEQPGQPGLLTKTAGEVLDPAGVTEALKLQQAASIDPALYNTADLSAYSQDERENILVYEMINEAVVNITTETVAINWFLEPVPQEGGSGSGSIIDTRGYVLTNNHVIENAYKVFISLADGSQYEGTVVGVDTESDLAVVKFDPPPGVQLKTIPFGDSAGLKVGQKALAIGNPFALERTLTVGIISGLGRPIQIKTDTIIQNMIQTDAAINFGNSGGPLLDAQGRMIGINTIIYSTSGGSVGIGFAVPINSAKRIVAELIEFGRVRRGRLDATLIQLFPELVRYASLPVESGLLVSRVNKGGLAEQAGLRQGSEPVRYRNSTIYLGGDIITAVDGVQVKALADYYSALEDNRPGDRVKVDIVRGTRTMSLTVTLADQQNLTN